MKIAFRVDASIQMGTGHVMRCLTLADALKSNGSECVFICRAHTGNLIELIQSKGYTTHTLPLTAENFLEPGDLTHSNWLGATQDEDAANCAQVLKELRPDWLIVDHYALDIRWEQALGPCCCKLMVIDDLADRQHACKLLLDQTYGRNPADYRSLVPECCTILCGAQYALLRPEFAALRPYSLKRRAKPNLGSLLINMGGVDKDNVTQQVLDALRGCQLPTDCRITVVMGATAPWLENIRQQAELLPWSTQVLVGVNNMAQLMADNDLAIGAAGATSWERCCMGLPSIVLLIAENQHLILSNLIKAEAIKALPLSSLSKTLNTILNQCRSTLKLESLSKNAADVCDGLGTQRITSYLNES